MKTINFNNHKITPSKIVCIGRNYVDHIKELNNEIPTEPVIFVKPNSAISNTIIYNHKDLIHYESEISFLVKNGQLQGVGFGLDLTKREIQSQLKSKGLPWERAKAFDSSAVFSDFVKFSGHLDHLSIELFINDKLVQSGNGQQMIYKPNVILSEIKRFMTLEDGDIIMTGTPNGVGELRQGDIMKGRILVNNHLLIESVYTVN